MKWMITLLALVSLNVFAEQVQICSITSDADSEKTVFSIEVVAEKLDSVRLYRTEGPRVLADDTYPTEKVIAEGIVAVRRQGRNIVLMRAENFTAEKGGVVVMDILYNGITGSRIEYKMKLLKVAGKFVLHTLEGVKFNRIFFNGHRKLGQVVGIASVKTSLVE